MSLKLWGCGNMDGFGLQMLQSSIKGLLFACWILGSLMVILLLFRTANRRLTKHLRLRSLNMTARYGSKASFSFADSKAMRHFADELEVAELGVGLELVLAIMLMLALVGFFGADAAVQLLQQRFAVGQDQGVDMHLWALSGVIAFLLGSLPYFYVRFRVQRKRHRIALRMIMLVQNLIGHYRPNLTLAEMIVKSSPTMPVEVRSEWRRLELALHMQSMDEALYDFARRIQNEWADDVADLLLIGAHYGTDLTESLHHLVGKMQAAKRHEESRLAMVTVYRLGTCFMVGFAFFVVGFNIYADGANYSHYFVDPTGKMLLMLSFAVMFVSMLLVIRSGSKAF
jgi:Flp pilus assembly protein TadB